MSDYIPVSVRQIVYKRANGRCEYCLTPEQSAFVPFQIDHIIARKHGGQTELSNLALACPLCNKYKGSDLTSIDPTTGEITPLYHPRRHNWRDHFNLNNFYIAPLTAVGRATTTLLQFNRPERIAERKVLLLDKLPD